MRSILPPRIERWFAARRRKDLAHIKKVGRLLGYFGFVGLLSAGWCYRSARAEVGEKMFEVGKNLSQLSDLVDTTHNFSMNGQHVYLSTGITDQTIDQVLDRYEQHCKDGGGVFSTLFKDAPPTGEISDTFKMGIVREQTNDTGAILCLVKGEKTPATALEALQTFADTQDFGSLGDARYVHVHRTSNGATKVTLLWTEGSVKLNELVAEGDREPSGRDPDFLPRPLGGKRLMSIDAVGTKYNAFVYVSDESPDAVMNDLKAKMDQQGWVTVGETADNVLARGFLKDDVTAYVGIQRDSDNGRTIVGMSEAEPGGGERHDRTSLR